MPSDKQRPIQILSATVVTTIIILVLYWARVILVPIAVAGFLTFVLAPLVVWLQHKGVGRSLSVLVVVGVVMSALVAVGAVVTHEIVTIAATLPDRREAIKEKIIAAKQFLVGNQDSRFTKLVNDIDQTLFPKQETGEKVIVEASAPPYTSQLQPILNPSMEILGQGALAFILTVYMLIRREDLRNRMIYLIGDGRVTTTTKAVDEASRRISRYLMMQLLINCTFGLTISFGLLLLGVDYVLLWGFIAALLRYIPYIGTWIGLIPVFLFSFATSPSWGGGWGQPIAVLGLYAGLELFTGNIIEPWVYGRSMGLSELAQLVAAAFWSFLWGPIGLILSTPLTACLHVLGKYVRGAEFLDVLLGDEPALEPKVAFYQRLAAHDQDEASAVAAAVAKSDGPDAVLDTVLIPALCLVRRDWDRGELDEEQFKYAVHATREVAVEIEELREASVATPGGQRVRIVISPARDEAEQAAGEILGAALDPQKWEVKTAGQEVLASELVAIVEEFHPVVIVLVALPPGGMAHCRYLVNRVKTKSQAVRIVIARWGLANNAPADDSGQGDDVSKLKHVDAIDRSILETRKRLAALHPVLLAEVEKLDADLRNEKPAVQHSAVSS